MERVMNLSAFGDIIKNGSTSRKVKVNFSDEDDPNKYGHIFKMILQNFSQTKLFHWQSYMYGQHKALDELFSGIISLGDKLAESIMGKYGKPVLSEENLTIKLSNFDQPEKGNLSEFMDHLYKCYAIDCKSILDPESDEELINIIDEIVALVDQVRYLISLR